MTEEYFDNWMYWRGNEDAYISKSFKNETIYIMFRLKRHANYVLAIYVQVDERKPEHRGMERRLRNTLSQMIPPYTDMGDAKQITETIMALEGVT